jgi:hypothetical protein
LTVVDDSLTTGLLYKFKFLAINLVGNSESSDISEFALTQVIAAPGQPFKMLAFTSEESLAVQWTQTGSSSPAGLRVSGYVLEMKDLSDYYGTFEVVFDGSELYPELKEFQVTQGIVPGRSYVFRVKGKYQNGYTPYSEESLPVYACSPPSGLQPVRLVSSTDSQISLEWSQPEHRGSCNL